MSGCCISTYNFCKPVNPCDLSTFGDLFKDLPDGTYTVILDFLNSSIMVAIIASTTEGVKKITLPDGFALNESYTYTGKIINAQGADVKLTFSNVEYDCFQFSTKIFR